MVGRHRAAPLWKAWSSSMATPGSGGVQYRRGKGRFNKDKGSRDRGGGGGGGGGGGAQAGKKKAESWKQQSAHRPGKVRRTWKSSQQVIAGSAKEGQGFALWRKQKVQLDYIKLQRKQKKTTAAKDLYADNYPEHLKHLYLAEEERLNNLKRKQKPEEQPTQTTEEKEEVVVVPKKKFKNKTSIQKAKEEYKRVQQERERKRKEAEENRRKRAEAKELYKKKKMEAYKVLNTKTKKGQPNFNVQMEYLLQKIQSQT